MLTEHQAHWGIDQWAAYLSGRPLPCMPRSKALLAAMEETRGDRLSARELADIAGADPFLCLHLLRDAEARRVQRLGHDTTTPLAAIMQIGGDNFHRLLVDSPETDEANRGLSRCEYRSHLASRLALRWGSARADISPDEVAMACLLAEAGELLLWAFAPDLPAAAERRLLLGQSPRSSEAQREACGFRFKDLTLKCAALWHLPPLVIQLIKGVDNPRANLSRACSDTARHLEAEGLESPALPSDLADVHRLVAGAPITWLVEQLPEVPPEHLVWLIEQTSALIERSGGAAA